MQAVEVFGYYQKQKCRIRFENADGTDFFTTTSVECKNEDARLELHGAIFDAYWGENSRFCGQWMLELDNYERVVVACEQVLDKDPIPRFKFENVQVCDYDPETER